MKVAIISLLFAIFTLAVVEYGAGYYLQPKKSESNQTLIKDVPEINGVIYSKLDPTLGYTFNREVTSLDFEKDFFLTLNKGFKTNKSYILFENKNNSNKVIRILILGGSATDSNLFNGNWPYQLHLVLKERGVAHEILNGAVSGYNSHQELLKLKRDLLSFSKIDVIINYNGVNDHPSYEDVLKGHPWVHPYQYYLFDRLIKNRKGFIGQILPNTIRLMEVLRGAGVAPELDLGFATEDYVSPYLLNVDLMFSLANIKKVNYLNVLQPLAWRKELRAPNFREVEVLESLNSFKTFYNEVKEEQKGKNYFFDLDAEINASGESGIFIDPVHLNEKGNLLVAKKILEKLNL